jgi:hypothetical protein
LQALARPKFCNRRLAACIYCFQVKATPAGHRERATQMNFGMLIPITLFICITYCIKLLVDARTRSKLIAANGSEELIRSLVQNEEQQRRHASVRWGVVLVCLAVGFALIEFFGWDDVTPGAIAVLLGATGVGNLVSYYISRDLPK